MGNKGSDKNRCPRCRVNVGLCYCDKLEMYDNKTFVSIIMHHRERYLTTNTAKLAPMTLKNAKLHLRGLQDIPIETEFCFLDNHIPLYLFPDEEAQTLSEDFLKTLQGKKVQLIVPDGSWKQAKKIKRRTPGLDQVQSVKLPFLRPTRYPLRRQTQKENLCTFEAIAYALSLLEGQQLGDKLLSYVDLLVERMMLSKNRQFRL